MSESDSPPIPDGATMKVGVVPVTAFQQNCSLVWCEETMRGAVVDPGGDVDRILAAIEQVGIEVEKILLTHAHLDHAAGAGALKAKLGVPIEGPHEADLFLIENLDKQTAKYGMDPAVPFLPDRWLADGDTVTVDRLSFAVRHCPGHTPGHVILYHEPSHFALVGDVIFQGSVGRTDLPGGDHAALIKSIREKLWPLGDEITFLPGHGPASTFAEERRSNPFCGDGVD